MSKHHDSTHHEKGASLARGPAWIVGTVLAVFGLALFFRAGGAPLSTGGFPDATVQGQSFLGFEVNAWSAWLTVAAGVLVLIGVIQHAIAKALSLVAGLALGAASVIALFDGDDVLGLAAANGWTALGWGVAAAILIITALLPRLGRKDDHDTTTHDRTVPTDRHDGTDRSGRDDQRDRVRDDQRDQVRDGDAVPIGRGDHDAQGDGRTDRHASPLTPLSTPDSADTATRNGRDDTRSVQIPPRG